MEVLADYSQIRGVCHNPAYDKSQVRLEKELGYCDRLNINSIRFWLQKSEYEKDPERYLNLIENFMESCGSHDISCMPILWNGNFIEDFSEPTEAEYQKDREYAETIINKFKDKNYLLMWDVFNEPMCNDYLHKAPEAEYEKRYNELKKYLRRLTKMVKELDPDNALTVGHEDVEHCESTNDLVDVISFHDYSPTRARIEAAIFAAEAMSKKWDKPILNTETGCVGRANPYDIELELAEKHNLGWYLFNLISEGFWGDIHGLVYPDGTVRDPAVISALFGFYRKRDKARIKANPNKEGHGYKAVKAVEKALKVEPTTLFQSKDKTAAEILEAAEYCVNFLEAAEMTAMWDAPSAKIEEWRKMDPAERDIYEIKEFAYKMAQKVKGKCYF